MDILTVLQTIVRRWAVVVPIVIITFVAAFVVGTGTEAEYGMDGTALLVSDAATPSASRQASPVAAISAPVLGETLRSAAVRDRLTGVGAAVPYDVKVDPTTSILQVTASSEDPAANMRTVEVVLENLAKELELLEETAEIPSGSRATVKQLSRPSNQPGAGMPSAVGLAFLVPDAPDRPNPYPPSDYTIRIIEERMLSAEAQAAVIQRAGATATFSVTQNQRDEAPILNLSVLGTSPTAVEKVFSATKETVDELLDERQAEAGVQENNRTRTVLLNAPAGAAKTSGTLVKTVVTIVGLGLIAAATAAIVVESIVAPNAARRRHKRDPGKGSLQVDENDLGQAGAKTSKSRPKKPSLRGR